MQKKCTECGELKQLSGFHKDKSKSDGYMNICKTCKRKKNHQQYINSLSPEDLIKYNRSKSRKKLLKEGKSVCSECGKVKPLDNFHKSKPNLGGYRSICKTCRNKEIHQSYINSLSSEELTIYKQKKDRKNLNNKLLKKGKYNCAKCGETKSLSEFHKDSSIIHGYSYVCKSCDKKYYLKYRIISDTWKKRYNNKKDDPQFKLNNSMSSGIRKSLKNNKNGRHWENLVGYTLVDLKKHLQKQFTDKMSWKNYGSYWHIDHILPISSFNFTKSEHIEFNECWALENLQPLEAKENIRKSNKLIKDKQEYLAI